jgi:serine protein kinase
MSQLEKIGKTVEDRFAKTQRLLSFGDYLKLVEEHPRRHTRSAAMYIRDVFDHYGTETVRRPRGEIRRFKLFDAAWESGEGRLVGQEEVQNAIYRILSNFVKQKRVDRFILLHGPNGSSKSTITEMISRAMEHYSTLDDGAIYRFNWIFPTQTVSRSGIGFGGKSVPLDDSDTFAYLEDSQIDARLFCELHDHPLLLVPSDLRATMLEELLAAGSRASGVAPADEPLLSSYLLKGELCTKCKLVYEALLNSYKGDFTRVLRHVQVERFFVSRRYREASTRVEPQLAVDARAHQVTADRSLSSLPTALQSISLYELDGDLVQANRGIIDYPDLLKRPIEAFKYLLTTVEDGRVVLNQTNLFFDLVFIGSSNETHVNAFMESPDWMSFKGRMELVQVPYLLEHSLERRIYDDQIGPTQVGRHVAPHSISVVALWGVLTRLHLPASDQYEDVLRRIVVTLSPLEKALLYDQGVVPSRLREDDAKVLRGAIPAIYGETASDVVYEGRTGASPRELRTVIMNAAQNARFKCLTPESILEELRLLVQAVTVYPYLRMESRDDYYDARKAIETVKGWYLEKVEADLRSASGLIEEASYTELFSRYLNHVTHFVGKEKLRNPVTGAFEDPDADFMRKVETELGIERDSVEFRQDLMTKIGAWSIDHVGTKPTYVTIFPDHIDKLRQSYFQQQRKKLSRLLRDVLVTLSGDEDKLPADSARLARVMIERLRREHGYCEHCAKEAISILVRTRFSE